MTSRFTKVVTKSSHFANELRNVALFLPLFAMLASCGDSTNTLVSQRERLSESVQKQSLLAMERPPVIVVKDAESLRVAGTLIPRLNILELARQKAPRFVEPNALPAPMR